MYMLLLKHQQMVRDCVGNAVRRVRSDERGQTMIEYALLAFLIAIAAILVLAAIGFDLEETFNRVEDALGLDAAEAPTVSGDNDTTPTP